MRRTGTRVRGRRFAALMASAGLAVGMASSAAYGVDSIRAQEWHLDAMHAQEMWQTSTGSGVTVAVVDTGVLADHPDLVGQLLPGKDFSGEGGITDNDGHGTGMAAMIAGTGKGVNGQGGIGLAPGARILPLKINSNGQQDPHISQSDALHQIDQAITYAADQGAKIINVSQAISANSLNQGDLADLKTAVDHVNAKGALVFAGAGNSGQAGNPLMYPAALPGVVAVAAIDQNGKTTDESEHGPQVALAAPGVDIYAACITPPSDYCKSHGTSDATALTSASAALVWSAHPSWTGNQVLRVLINTAGKPQDGSSRSDFVGYGVVRPRIALTTPGDPGPADVSPLAGVAAPTGGASAPTGGASAPVASAPANGDGTPATGGVASPSAKKSSSMGLIVGGAAVGLLVLVVVIVLIARNSRKGSTPPPMAPMPGGYPGPQPPQPPYGGGYPMQQQPPAPGGYPQQPPVQPGAFPPPPQGPNPPQGGNPYGR